MDYTPLYHARQARLNELHGPEEAPNGKAVVDMECFEQLPAAIQTAMDTAPLGYSSISVLDNYLQLARTVGNAAAERIILGRLHRV
jgi:hypothetical protein